MGNLVLFFWKFLNRFVPGRAGTEEFVSGHLLLPLSRENGTPGQHFFLCRDKGTTGRPVPWKLLLDFLFKVAGIYVLNKSNRHNDRNWTFHHHKSTFTFHVCINNFRRVDPTSRYSCTGSFDLSWILTHPWIWNIAIRWHFQVVCTF